MADAIHPACSDWVKQRRLRLATRVSADPGDFTGLRAIPGLKSLRREDHELMVTYDLRLVRLADLLPRLRETGIDIGNNLGQRIRLAYWLMTEDVQAHNADRDSDWASLVRDIYLSQYRHRRHGRRDDRPRHWRKYEAS